MNKHAFRYSSEHLAFLATGYKKHSVQDLAPLFNKQFGTSKTADQLKSIMKNHKIYCGRKTGEINKGKSKLFTPAQVLYIRTHYSKLGRKGLTLEFNKTFKTEITINQIIAFVKNNKIHSGRSGHYKAGHKSWNSNTAGTGICKANSGSFQKGIIAINVRPVGSERVNVEGYIEIKTTEEGKWEYKQRVVWIANFGPIPARANVCFKDGNKQNPDKGNLFLASNAEHMYLQHLNYPSAPLEIKPTVLLLARVQAKAHQLSAPKTQ